MIMLKNLLLLLAAPLPSTSASHANAFATFIEETKAVETTSNAARSNMTERSSSAFEFVGEESEVPTENASQLDAMTSLLLREGQLDDLDKDDLMNSGNEGMNKRHAYKEKKSGKATKSPTVSGKAQKQYNVTMSPTVHNGKPSGSTGDSGKSGKAINEEKQSKKAEKKKDSESSNKKDGGDESKTSGKSDEVKGSKKNSKTNSSKSGKDST
jgi:hypothetical protein